MENQPEFVHDWIRDQEGRIIHASNVMRNVWKPGDERAFGGRTTLFRVRGKLVPDFLYGYSNLDHHSSLVDTNAELDTIRDSIIDVAKDTVSRQALAIRDALSEYQIATIEFAADYISRTLSVKAKSFRSPLQVDGVMSNGSVRSVMQGNVSVSVLARAETVVWSDKGRKDTVRKWKEKVFGYENGTVDRPIGMWSAGPEYIAEIDEYGYDGLRTVWIDLSCEREHTESGAVLDKRPKVRAALGVRERSYQQRARRR